MQQTALVFLFNAQGQILLGMKKRGFGVGKWNGPGGKLEAGESVIQGALRELEEEVGVVLKEEDLQYKGALKFRFQDTSKNSTDCSVFFANYEGAVLESEEMQPQWFTLEEIPFEEMRPDDQIWLPEALKGKGEFVYEFLFTSPEDKTPQWKKMK